MSILGQSRHYDRGPALPVYPHKQTSPEPGGMSQTCRYCCKSPKTPGDQISAKRRNKRQSSIDVASNAPPKSPVSSSQNEVVPHINVRSPRLQPRKFVIGKTKRVLQHYLPTADGNPGTNSTTVWLRMRPTGRGAVGRPRPFSKLSDCSLPYRDRHDLV
jgi:hypothetical protein